MEWYQIVEIIANIITVSSVVTLLVWLWRVYKNTINTKHLKLTNLSLNYESINKDLGKFNYLFQFNLFNKTNKTIYITNIFIENSSQKNNYKKQLTLLAQNKKTAISYAVKPKEFKIIKGYFVIGYNNSFPNIIDIALVTNYKTIKYKKFKLSPPKYPFKTTK